MLKSVSRFSRVRQPLFGTHKTPWLGDSKTRRQDSRKTHKKSGLTRILGTAVAKMTLWPAFPLPATFNGGISEALPPGKKGEPANGWVLYRCCTRLDAVKGMRKELGD